MSEMQNTVARFEKELKQKVNLRTTGNVSAEKVLLDAFKYYDLEKTSVADEAMFLKVVKLRLNISTLSDVELRQIWRFYAGSGALRYRDFVTQLFDANVQLMPVEVVEERETRSFTGNKLDVVREEEVAKRVIELIVFKLRQKEMSSFLKLYREFVISAGEGGLTLNHFTKKKKKMGIEISFEDTSQLFNFLRGSRNELDYLEVCQLLSASHSEERKTSLRRMFDKLDFAKSGRLNIGLLKDIFNPRNHFAYRSGRLTLEEVEAQFFEFVDLWPKVPRHSLVVGAESFLFFFSFLSAHTREDKDFSSLVENCFRFAELPRMSAASGKHIRSEVPSARLGIPPAEALASMASQLAKKGNRAHISFFKALKFNDFDHDGLLYQKELTKALKELRLDVSEPQLRGLFAAHADPEQRIRFEFILEKLVPPFEAPKVEMIKDLYTRLFAGEVSHELSFLAVQNAFNSKGHPDVKTGQKDQTEVRNEFLDALQTFLTLTKGSHLSVSLYEFVRFFEFFARNWDFEYLQSVLLLAFRTRADSARSSKSNQDDEASNLRKPKKEPVESRISYPFYTSDGNEPTPAPKDFAKKEHKVNYPYYAEEEAEKKSYREPSHRGNPQVNRANESHYSAAALELNHDAFQKKGSFSPESYSIKESVRQSERSISNLNEHLKLQRQTENVDPELSGRARQKLKLALGSAKSFSKTLELEYELTTKSDPKGTIDFDVFSVVLESSGFARDITADELRNLFLNSVGKDKRLHVQTFVNELRGQLDEPREIAGVQLFEKLTTGSREPLLAVDRLRTSLIPLKAAQKFFKSLSSLEVKETWDYLIDLFVCLNLQSRKRSELELDDFLYFLDNFSPYIASENDFKEFLAVCFK